MNDYINSKKTKFTGYSFVFVMVIITSMHADLFAQKKTTMETKKNTIKTDQEWNDELTPEQYHVLRACGTEPAFTGKYVNHHEDGYYYCAGCGSRLFSSETKYESGSGWPSFYNAVADSSIVEVLDKSHGMIRTEIKCGHCNGHLGHLFNDGPDPSGMRYCVNSMSLEFKKE